MLRLGSSQSDGGPDPAHALDAATSFSLHISRHWRGARDESGDHFNPLKLQMHFRSLLRVTCAVIIFGCSPRESRDAKPGGRAVQIATLDASEEKGSAMQLTL